MIGKPRPGAAASPAAATLVAGMVRTMSSRPRVLSTTPLLVVADLQRSLGFYCQKLGFGEPSVWGEPPCFAMLHRDASN